jgi:hypothetical protein
MQRESPKGNRNTPSAAHLQMEINRNGAEQGGCDSDEQVDSLFLAWNEIKNKLIVGAVG